MKLRPTLLACASLGGSLVLAAVASAQPIAPGPTAPEVATPAPQPESPAMAPLPVDDDDDDDEATADDDASPDARKHHNPKKHKKHKKGHKGSDDAAPMVELTPAVAPSHKKSKQEKQREALTFAGRVFVRETLASTESSPWTAALELASARLEADYRHKKVRAHIEVDAASGKVKTKDAFAELDLPHGLTLRAGAFRQPTSAIESTGATTLPTVDRGFGSSIYSDGLEISGRRTGAVLGWKPKHLAGFKIVAGAFQWQTAAGDTQPGLVTQGLGLNALVRAEQKIRHGVEVSAWASTRRPHDVNGALVKRRWAAGVNLELNFDKVCGPRAWVEFASGSSALDASPASNAVPHFISARSIAAWRFGARDGHAWFIEPFVAGTLLDANVADSGDMLLEGALGVNVGRWQRWRLQVQGETRSIASGRPNRLAGDAPLAERIAIITQLGVWF